MNKLLPFVRFIYLFVALTLVLAGARTGHSASLSGRHVFMLHPGVDAVWGTYLLVVENPGGEPTSIRFPVMLPEETVDFQPQQGISPDQLKLADDGLVVEAEFERESALIAIGFRVEAKGGEGVITLKAPFAIREFAVMLPDSKITLDAPGFTFDPNVAFSGRRFSTWYVGDVQAGDTLTFSVVNVPQGRSRYWFIGSLAGLCIFSFGGLLAVRSRPSEADLHGDAFASIEGTQQQ